MRKSTVKESYTENALREMDRGQLKSIIPHGGLSHIAFLMGYKGGNARNNLYKFFDKDYANSTKLDRFFYWTSIYLLAYYGTTEQQEIAASRIKQRKAELSQKLEVKALFS